MVPGQRLFVEGAACLGATIDGSKLARDEFAGALQAVFADTGARVSMAAAGRAARDGEGATRVAERLLALCDEVTASRQAAG